jgi:hypothetical protein
MITRIRKGMMMIMKVVQITMGQIIVSSLTAELIEHSLNKEMWSYLNNKVVIANYLIKDIM